MRTTVPLAAAVALLSFAARADVVDLSGGSSRRSTSITGWSLRLEGGNSYSPYGFFGACLGYLTDSLFAIEGGAGAGFPGLQMGLAVRKLFGEDGSYIATEIAFAGNTKVPRGGSSQAQGGAAPPTISTDRYVWGTLGAGYEQRTGRFTAGFIAALALTPSDGNAHFALHGGVGYIF